ncbi:hypothetical protein HHI36_006020 [Cryptolaemus montrouzieri]|uniref:Transmembrane protein n=1 Tax=Cryptolaemus montrouzieri TaxID=559131 RepID=A0ABD2NX90_9CUCU
MEYEVKIKLNMRENLVKILTDILSYKKPQLCYFFQKSITISLKDFHKNSDQSTQFHQIRDDMNNTIPSTIIKILQTISLSTIKYFKYNLYFCSHQKIFDNSSNTFGTLYLITLSFSQLFRWKIEGCYKTIKDLPCRSQVLSKFYFFQKYNNHLSMNPSVWILKYLSILYHIIYALWRVLYKTEISNLGLTLKIKRQV